MQWNPTAGAVYYDIVRGDLFAIREGPAGIDLGTVAGIERHSFDAATSGSEKGVTPVPGGAFYYLVESNDGGSTSLGTESVPKPRVPDSGGCQ